MPEIQRLIFHDISQLDKFGRGRFDITLAERGVFVQGKPACLGRTRVTKNHQKVSCAISEEMWNPVGSGILSSELPDLETFTMRLETWLSSGCAPPVASTKARTQSQTWNCCENVLVTWHPKNMIKDLNLNKFLWFFEGDSRSLNFRHQAPSNSTQPRVVLVLECPIIVGKQQPGAWIRSGCQGPRVWRSIFPRLVAMKLQFPTYCLFCWGISPELILNGFWLNGFLVVEFVEEQSLYILLRHHCLVLNANGMKASTEHPYMQGDNHIGYLCADTLSDHKTYLVACAR